MGLLYDKNQAFTEALKKLAENDILQAEKIEHLFNDASMLKTYAKSLSEDEINHIKNSLGTQELLKITKIINEVKSRE